MYPKFKEQNCRVVESASLGCKNLALIIPFPQANTVSAVKSLNFQKITDVHLQVGI